MRSGDICGDVTHVLRSVHFSSSVYATRRSKSTDLGSLPTTSGTPSRLAAAKVVEAVARRGDEEEELGAGIRHGGGDARARRRRQADASAPHRFSASIPPMPRLRSIGFALASLGLVLSTMVHVASFFAVESRTAITSLFFGATGLMLPLVAAARAGRRGWTRPGIRELIQDAPPWGERVFQLIVLNSLGHFGALIFAERNHASGGTPLAGYQARTFSAFVMMVYLLCTLAWWRRDPGAQRTA